MKRAAAGPGIIGLEAFHRRKAVAPLKRGIAAAGRARIAGIPSPKGGGPIEARVPFRIGSLGGRGPNVSDRCRVARGHDGTFSVFQI